MTKQRTAPESHVELIIKPKDPVEIDRLWSSHQYAHYCYVKAYDEERAIQRAKQTFIRAVEAAT